jgi:DNA mismatch repair protein MutS2
VIYPSTFETKIGFDQIRERLRQYCLSPLGVQQVDSLSFQTDYVSILCLLREVNELVQLKAKGDILPMRSWWDPGDCLKTLMVEGSYWEEEQFYYCRLSLATYFDAKNYLDKNKELYPNLGELIERVALPRKIIELIDAKLDDAGKMKDTATPELQQIRKQLRAEEGKVRKLTEQLFRSVASQGYVPEGASPTVREGRLVIPLLAEHKRKIKGFIVDESATGQTIYLEPAEVLEANNEIRDLMHAERREVIKALKELTGFLAGYCQELRNAFEWMGKIDLVNAKSRLASALNAALPQLNKAPELQWFDAYHPLLVLGFKNDKKVIPLTIEITDQDRFLLVSGPNAGGKSVCLKSVGLLQYMLQCGLLVPVQSHSKFGIFQRIFIDIGDQQSIENDLSTYSSHLKNVGYFLKHSGADTLVLLDELGTGTDPNFGGGIAEAVLDSLLEKNVWGVATTHYYNLKLFAETRVGIRNASMQFDTKSLRPLFQLEIGKPGSSFALEIARKTGLPEKVLQKAEQIIGKELTGLETLMKTVAEEKLQLAKKEKDFKEKQEMLHVELNRYKQLSQQLEARKKEIIHQAKTEAAQLLKETNREIEKTIRHIQQSKANKNETRKVRGNLQQLAEKVKPEETERPTPPVELKLGDSVRIVGQEVSGRLLSIKGNSATVQFGQLQANLKISQLVRSDLVEVIPPELKKAHSVGVNVMAKQANFNPLLDVRGMRAEEVEPLLIQFLDDAILLSQGQLKIIHGKGEGILRKVVRDRLKKTRGVSLFTDEHADRGGDGATVVVLK